MKANNRTPRRIAHDILRRAAQIADGGGVGGCEAISTAYYEEDWAWGAPRPLHRADALDDAQGLAWRAFDLFEPPRHRLFWWGNPVHTDPQPRVLALLLAAQIVKGWRDAD